MLNFIESQKEDGRICLWGADILPNGVAGGNFPQQREGVSSLPKLFDVTYHLLKGTNDEALKSSAYKMLKKYLEWWFSARFDEKTGLMSAVFEETFIPYLGCAGEYAPVDTNVELCVACRYTAELAVEHGEHDYAECLEKRMAGLKESINKYLWNEERGAYFPYLLKEGRQGECLMASTFFPLRMQIADEEKKARLLSLLTSNEHFNWDRIPLTSVSMKDPAFVTTEGHYKGNASWSGNVWTLINETVIRGLSDSGENALAAELAVKTLRAFSSNCAEFVNPFDGRGHGVVKYAWTASQYLELLIEKIFGVAYIAESKTVTVAPKLTDELKAIRIELSGLCVAEGITLDVAVDHGKVICRTSGDVKVKTVLDI